MRPLAAAYLPFTCVLAKVEFIWKVNPSRKCVPTWTDTLLSSLERTASTTAAEASLVGKPVPSKAPPRFLLTGPYGGGLGGLEELSVLVFITAGVGITPAASVISAGQEGAGGRLVPKSTYVVWSFRSVPLFDKVEPYFRGLPPSHCHFHCTATTPQPQQPASDSEDPYAKPPPTEIPSTREPRFKSGRPQIVEILRGICMKNVTKGLADIGVFVCGPDAMVRDVVKASEFLNGESHQGTERDYYVHVHAESFQM